MEKGRKKQSFLHGSLILVIATALVKIIGAIFKIPLYNILDNTGVGYYTTVYDLYTPMYTIAMAGLPIAISRIVAECVSLERYRDAKRTFKVAKLAMWVTGGVGFLLMCLLAYPYAAYKGTLEILPCVLCIAPCLLFCCVMSSYRGYYEGLHNMTPTAISEVLEALGKLVIGLVLAVILKNVTGKMEYAVCGALLGITLGTAVSAGYLVLKYKKSSKTDFTPTQLKLSPKPRSNERTLKMIIAMALPIVLGSLVTQITTLIDNLMITARLEAAINSNSEYMQNVYGDLIVYEQAQYLADGKEFSVIKDLPIILYGAHRGLAFSIYNLVPVLTSVLGVSAIPVLTDAWTKRDKNLVKSSMETVLRTTALVSMPAAFGLMALGREAVALLYPGKIATTAPIAGTNLCILGVCALFAGLTAPVTSMLQAIGKPKIPLYNMAVGALLKIIVNFILVGTPEINITGVPIGTAVCYAYICVMNIVMLIKCSGVKPSLSSVIVKPIFAGALCGISAFVAAAFFRALNLSNTVLTAVSIIIAVFVYVISVILFKIIKKSDIISLPKGEKLVKVLEKFKVIG